MPNFRTNEAVFDVPDDWSDQTIVAFRIPAAPGGREASFVVTRDPGLGSRQFGLYVSDQEAQCRKSLPGFTFIKSDRLEVGAREAAWVEFTWRNEGQTMLLRQIYFNCAPLAILCTLTVRPEDLFHIEPAWSDVMGSLDFDRVPTQQHSTLSNRR